MPQSPRSRCESPPDVLVRATADPFYRYMQSQGGSGGSGGSGGGMSGLMGLASKFYVDGVCAFASSHV
jgi:hypothetical protein